MRFILSIIAFLCLISCKERRTYLTDDQKELLVYELGDTLKLVNENNTDSIALRVEEVAKEMRGGCFFSSMQEYGLIVFRNSKNCSASFMVPANQYNIIEFYLKTPTDTISESYSNQEIIDSIFINNISYKNVLKFYGNTSNLYLSKKEGILKITTKNDSLMFYRFL